MHFEQIFIEENFTLEIFQPNWHLTYSSNIRRPVSKEKRLGVLPTSPPPRPRESGHVRRRCPTCLHKMSSLNFGKTIVVYNTIIILFRFTIVNKRRLLRRKQRLLEKCIRKQKRKQKLLIHQILGKVRSYIILHTLMQIIWFVVFLVCHNLQQAIHSCYIV